MIDIVKCAMSGWKSSNELLQFLLGVEIKKIRILRERNLCPSR